MQWRSDVRYANSFPTDTACKTFLRLYQAKFQVPDSFQCDRAFVQNIREAMYVTHMEALIVQRRGNMDDITTAICDVYSERFRLDYKSDKTKQRIQHVVEWLFLMTVGRVITWLDFEVGRASTSARVFKRWEQCEN